MSGSDRSSSMWAKYFRINVDPPNSLISSNVLFIGRFIFLRTTTGRLWHARTQCVTTPGLMNKPRRIDDTAGQMDGEAGDHKREDWTPPLARVKGVGRQQHVVKYCFSYIKHFIIELGWITRIQNIWEK